MQDFLTKYKKIDVVWCQDDDMTVGVLQAIATGQAQPTSSMSSAAPGSKDMIKKVMDGDKMIPVDVLYPPAMVGTAPAIDGVRALQPGSGQGHLTRWMRRSSPRIMRRKLLLYPDSPY